MTISIRKYQPADWPQVWAILEPIFRDGETYPCPIDITEDESKTYWIDTPQQTFVAVDESGKILGSYYIKPNQVGLGSHVANCGVAVHQDARGKGIATKFCAHIEEWAPQNGFRAVQGNLIVSTNEVAVRLWDKLGFKMVGRLPGAFNSRKHGYVDAFVCYKELA